MFTDLILGDCLEKMKDIPDKSVDLVLCDPPYGTTACKWDNVIPFDLMWAQIKRIRKDNAAVCLFGSEPFSSHLRLSNIKEFKYDWIWQKSMPNNFAQASYQPMKYHEIVSVFYKSKSKFFPIMQDRSDIGKARLKSSGKVLDGSNNKSNFMNFNRGQGIYREYDKNLVNPKSVQIFNSVPNCNGTKLHPTQKPVPLLEYLIKTYTLENETVLDFTMGSGSTGVACKNLNRNFIGIEQDEKYFEIAKNRING
jgi:site-specific DNA-methyltransferase (adenine-specific)